MPPARDIRSSVGALLRRHLGLVLVLAAGGALRLVLILAYSPAIINFGDTWGYVKGADEEIFVPEVRRPAGYALFLRGLHTIASSVELVVVVQHLLGLTAAVLVYAIVLRATRSRWLALVPAAVAALSLDFLSLEHSLLSETLFMVLILLGLLAALIGVESGSSAPSRRQLAWLAAAGFVLGAALTVRAAGLFALLPAVLLIPGSVRGPWLRRLGSAAAVAVPAMIIVLGYASAQQATNGVFRALARGAAGICTCAPPRSRTAVTSIRPPGPRCCARAARRRPAPAASSTVGARNRRRISSVDHWKQARSSANGVGRPSCRSPRRSSAKSAATCGGSSTRSTSHGR